MAKAEYFTSVQDWVNADYSITISDAGGLNETTLSRVGQILRAEGPKDSLAKIWPYFEAYNLRVLKNNGAPYDGALPLETVEDHFETSGDSGMMSMFAAMAFTRSMLAENRGFIDKAVSHIEHAIEMSPETPILYRRLSKLTGQTETPPPSSFIGKSLNYNLPRKDPTQKFIQSHGPVDIEESVSRLNPGQFILVCLMSGYRTNGPYVEGFERARTPLAKLRDKFREIHIITSWNKANSRDLPHWPVMEPALVKSGATVSVLYDENDTIAESVSLISAPTNLIIDHTGSVVAEGWLGDDKVLWDALSHSV